MIRTLGLLPFTYAAIPAMSPPPPIGTNRALAGYHGRIIERVNKRQALCHFEFAGFLIGVIIGVAMQNYLTAERLNSVNFYRRRGYRHYDDRPEIAPPGCQRDALRVVAGGTADHAGVHGSFWQLVVCPAQFERENRLQIFALHQHPVVQTQRQITRQFKWRYFRDIVNRRRVYQGDIVISGHLRARLTHRSHAERRFHQPPGDTARRRQPTRHVCPELRISQINGNRTLAIS